MKTEQEIREMLKNYDDAVFSTSDHIVHHRNAEGENEEFLRWLEGKADILKWVLDEGEDMRFIERYPHLNK
ncbi:MAG: hypothetical protein PHY72_02685 [Candidatus Pacebacteria bacterium]|nr:hypothetical protein [Candidatus Paceibacterota bacterium]